MNSEITYLVNTVSHDDKWKMNEKINERMNERRKGEKDEREEGKNNNETIKQWDC